MPQDKILLLTVGLPRSGKSTWSSTKLKEFPVVNPDNIRLAIHGQPFIGEAEPLVWAFATYMVETLFLTGYNQVILDATSVKRSDRDKWKSPKWLRKYKTFETPKETCIQRALEGGKDYLVPVIERMALAYQPVEEDEWDK